ncbi:hypothetical protein B0H16DRAFT_1682601 [Mycena metata]|uniref:F-box domain-containing protein n=1 Tax=Mycena metata TaxID=1033252 RepID=A0AAD7KDR7_9AGAR|nr:hypothetical protein B0H16DRAFT_1682601 [Mycena metata]
MAQLSLSAAQFSTQSAKDGGMDKAMAPSSPAAQFLDLPNEVVLLILGHPDLPSEALLYLSMLCRRLHHLSLSIYFDIYGLSDPTQNANIIMRDSRLDPLSALQMALFIPSVVELSCSLPHYETSIRPLFPHIRRLRACIGRLAFIRKVTLALDEPNSSRHSAAEEGVDTWTLEFGGLLNTILQRGCTSLTLRYGTFYSDVFEPRPTSSRLVVKPVHALRNVVRHILPDVPPGSGWDFLLNAGTSMEFDLQGHSTSALTHLKIESSMLLLPPCVGWTLSTLQHSPITTLEFVGITLPTRIWSTVLPFIPNLVPALTELNLSILSGISGLDVLLLIAKLPRLKILTIGYTEYSRLIQSACPDSGPIPKLLELTHLNAPSTFIRHFLRKNSMPSLTALCISPRRPIISSGLRLRHILGPVSEILRRLEKYNLAPVLSLELQCGRGSDAEMAADLTGPAPGEDIIQALRAITRLIVCSHFEMAAPELGTLARWIARFPNLVHVSLRVRSAVEATFDDARAISEQNPNVVSLELNGKLFDARNIPKPKPPEIPPYIGV